MYVIDRVNCTLHCGNKKYMIAIEEVVTSVLSYYFQPNALTITPSKVLP